MAVGAKIAKTADRKKVMGGIYISCSACEFYEKL
jgi:hypothetical protein